MIPESDFLAGSCLSWTWTPTATGEEAWLHVVSKTQAPNPHLGVFSPIAHCREQFSSPSGINLQSQVKLSGIFLQETETSYPQGQAVGE